MKVKKQILSICKSQRGRESNSKNDVKTASIFGQIVYPIDNFELTLGGRYQQIKKNTDLRTDKIDSSGIVTSSYFLKDSITWNKFLPKIALTYFINDKLNLYTSYSKGYLAGGYNYVAEKGTKEENRFKPQSTNNYEIGLKASFDNFRFSASLYQMDIYDTHIYKITDSWQYITSNAGKSKSKGIEFEGLFQATDELSITLAANYTHTKYGDYFNKDGSNNKGNYIERTPKYKINLGASYFLPSGIYTRADLNFIGDTYFNQTNTLKEDAYLTVDAKLGYIYNNFDFYVYAKNLMNKDYIVNIVDARGYTLTFDRGRFLGLGLKYTF